MSFFYIASPYSHANPEVRQARFYAVMSFTAWMLNERLWCYSPIVHCHELTILHKLPFDAKFWLDYNRAMLEVSDGMMVLTLDGWKESVGVRGEIEMAKSFGLPVNYMEPLDASNQNPRANSLVTEIQDRTTLGL